MIANQNKFYISPEDYLEGERVSPIKHEYRGGQVYAMTGAKNPHTMIVINLVALLANHFSNRQCFPFALDTKVRLEEADCYYYPDIVVTCDEEDLNSTADFILYPTLIVEVLSPSTEKFDRGEKFADYQTSPKLEEYVLVSQSEKKVECFRRNDAGVWMSEIYGLGDKVEFKSVNFRCDIESIYLKVPGI